MISALAVATGMRPSPLTPNGFFPGQDTSPQFGPIRDMGGCDVDLEGGDVVAVDGDGDAVDLGVRLGGCGERKGEGEQGEDGVLKVALKG